jgi:hypothetical protein
MNSILLIIISKLVEFGIESLVSLVLKVQAAIEMVGHRLSKRIGKHAKIKKLL